MVADSQRLFAESLVFALQEHGEFDIVPEWSITGRQVLRHVAEHKPDVALIDFWITDMAGPPTARAVLRLSPSTRVLFLTEFFIGPVQRQEAATAGALWFLNKDLPLNSVVNAIHAAAATSPAPRPPDDATPDWVLRLMSLTSREIEVLQLLRQGNSYREVSKELMISPGTVKNHLHKIVVKTGVASPVEAMIIAEAEGFISSEPIPRTP